MWRIWETDLIENKYQGSGRTIKEHLKDFDRYHGLTREDAIFFNQSDLICKMAKEEDFIVMGRCADVILANNHIPHISIFITAPFEQRVRRIMEVNDLDHKKAVRLLKSWIVNMQDITIIIPVRNGRCYEL